jgi:hypothetical protein
MTNHIIEALGKWLVGRGYRAFHEAPLDNEAEHLTYWTNSDKHKTFTQRDSEFFRCYVMFTLATAARFAARGIEVPGRGFVRADVAVMNSCLNAKLVTLDDGLFKLTGEGLSQLGLALPR